VTAQGIALGLWGQIIEQAPTGRNNAVQYRGFRPVEAFGFRVAFSWGDAPGYHILPRWGGIARVQRRLRFHAPCGSGPKAHNVKAQGIALGLRGHPIEQAPTGRNNAVQHRRFRPVGALVFFVAFSWGDAPGFHILPRWGGIANVQRG